MAAPAQPAAPTQFFQPTAHSPSLPGNSGHLPRQFEVITPQEDRQATQHAPYSEVAKIAQGLAIMVLIGGVFAGVFIGGLVAVNFLFTAVGLSECGMLATGLITAFVITRLCAR